MKKTILLTVLFLFLLTVLFLFLLIPAARAFDIKIENTMDRIVSFRFTWLDCDWEGCPKIMHMWEGEIQPGATLVSGGDYVAGSYLIRWSSTFFDNDKFTRTYPFIIPINSNIGIVFSSPMEKPKFFPEY